MPELAEVEFHRKQWDPGLGGRVERVRLHADKRVFRGCNTTALRKALKGARLEASHALGKQMAFRFSGGHWLGVHLGMAGKLFCRPLPYAPDKHDHLVLEQDERALVFNDFRLFGRIRFDAAAPPEGPSWWREQPPSVLSEAFTRDRVAAFLQRHKRAPIKAVLLNQEAFPGIGNWMADEILWRARVHPAERAGDLKARQVANLHREIREVARTAVATTGVDHSDPPEGWLFHVRWKDGGRCPKTRKPLERDVIGGRRTCWSPARQRRNAA
jgi:formamidopyrimidine-DNA glycosylase